jgi:fatty acid desaturase
LDPKYSELARAAHSPVDKSFLAALKEKRPTAVLVATTVIWSQLVLAWTLALLGPLWPLFIPVLISCALAQATLLRVREASHVSLFDNRPANDLRCDIFLCGADRDLRRCFRYDRAQLQASIG